MNYNRLTPEMRRGHPFLPVKKTHALSAPSHERDQALRPLLLRYISSLRFYVLGVLGCQIEIARSVLAQSEMMRRLTSRQG